MLSKLSAGDVRRLYANRLDSGLSGTSVRHVHSVLHRALRDAVRWGLLSVNPTDAVNPPRRTTPEAKTWSQEEVVRVLQTADQDGFGAFWRLALTTGMRRGELLGLRWADVDLDAGSLSVRRTLSRGSTSRLELGEPKTASGKRRIALSVSMVESLRRHRRRQLEARMAAGPAWVDQDLVFANEVGASLHPNTVAYRLGRLIASAGVPRIRFHDLRHTSATLLLRQGIHPRVVQERLGHADIAMTLNLYSHVTADMQRAAADALEATLLSTQPQTA